MQVIDEFAKSNNVKIKRKLFPQKLLIELKASFTDIISWSKVVYYSGNITGQNGLFVDINDLNSNILEEDILYEIILWTSNYRNN